MSSLAQGGEKTMALHKRTGSPTSRRTILDERGSVLLPVLAICLCMCFFVCTASIALEESLQIQAWYAWQRQAYWLARSVALQTLSQVKAGGAVPGQRTIQSPAGQVTILLRRSSAWTIQVSAVTPYARDTVQCSYDPMARRVTLWQDNGTAS